MKRYHCKLKFYLLLIAVCLDLLMLVKNVMLVNVELMSNQTLVYISESYNITYISQSFNEFNQIFNPTINQEAVVFEHGKDIKTLVKQLDNLKISTIVYTTMENYNQTSEIVDENNKITGYCDVMAKQLSNLYNKTIYFWPCPRMKTTEQILPSYETISHAIKSISEEFNWTEAVIFATEFNWELPLAIAANLLVPYRIEIGIDNLYDIHFNDANGKVIIIGSPLGSPTTIKIINRFKALKHTKILLIDMIGSIFNNQHPIFSKLNATEYDNLLVLTILSEKFKKILNKSFHVEFNRYYNLDKNKKINNQTNVKSDSKNVPFTSEINEKLLLRTTEMPTTKTFIMHSDATRNQMAKPMVKLKSEQRKPVNNDEKHQVEHSQVINSTTFDGFVLENKCNISMLTSMNMQNAISENATMCESIFTGICASPHPETVSKNNNHFALMIKQICKIILANSKRQSPSNRVRSVAAANPTSLKIKQIDKSMKQSKYLLNSNDAVDEHDNVDEEGNSDFHKMNNHFIFSEYFNLFSFVASIVLKQQKQQLQQKLFQDNRFGNLSLATVVIPFDFVVLDFRNILNSINESIVIWRPFLVLQHHQHQKHLFTAHPVLPAYNDWILESSEKFWTCGLFCWSLVAASLVLLILIIVGSLSAGIAVRNYLLKKRLSKGPNRIVLSSADFVFPIDARRVDEGIEAMLCCWLQQLQEFGGPEVDKPDLLKGSIGSLKNLGLPSGAKNNSGTGSLARHNTLADFRARYNGDLVQMKEIPCGTSTELKAKAMDLLVMAHGLRHENINPLIGWLNDPTRTAMVFEFCSRGSLQDVLIMDEIKLDWSFRLSLLTDLVRGMRYLHASPIRVHGGLTSRNCVVDARWVLKITDYGLPSFYESQGVVFPTKTAKQLLWTAPEAVRNTKYYPKVGTQSADVYSFGIIMQEVVLRGEPYCMLNLSPDEIIAKIIKPPPLIRPSVSKGAAPPEAINIMRQCWAENPEMRPDFATVCERFKQLNHGRKVNFVDTMFQMLEKYSNNLEELIRERTELLDIERKKTEQLLNRMLPSSVAEKLKMGLAVDPEEFSEVTIYFSDIVGFTTIAAHCSPFQVVDLLNDLYTCFDALINAYNVYKVETIGDAYMVVGGLPVRTPDHAEQIATMALDLLHKSGEFQVKYLPGVPLQLRIGLHSGPCCAGVVGLTMPRYCLFGDTVNTASRMESSGSSWRIHMSQETCDRLEKAGGYLIESRGLIEIKGKGKMNTYWLLGKKGFDKPLPTPPPIGLDESLIRNSMIIENESNKLLLASATSTSFSTNPSSSHSPSVTGEVIDVKVEITPPTNNIEYTTACITNSVSLDSTTFECPTKTTTGNSQPRKFSEIVHDPTLLNPGTAFNRLNPSPPGNSSSRLFKRIEEMMDLSSPYNHYRCLSPSESNLSQCITDTKFGAFNANKFDNSKPGSSRLLRRQFSLDKDDGPQKTCIQKSTLETISSSLDVKTQTNNTLTTMHPQQQLSHIQYPIPPHRLHKQHSTSMAQDLEKIEEIPSISSPTTNPSNDFNSFNNSLNISNCEQDDFCLDLCVASTNHTLVVATNNVNHNHNHTVNNINHSEEKKEISLKVETLASR